jgi:hypothetical protein
MNVAMKTLQVHNRLQAGLAYIVYKRAQGGGEQNG